MQRTSLEAGTDTSHHPREPLITQETLPVTIDAHIDGFLKTQNIGATPPEGTRITLPPTQNFGWWRTYLRRPTGEDELHYSSPDSVVLYSMYRGNPIEGTSLKHTVYDLSAKAIPRNSERLEKTFEAFAALSGIIDTKTTRPNGHAPIETPQLVTQPVLLTEGVLQSL